MKRAITWVIVIDLCVLIAVGTGWVGVIACWFLCPFAWVAFYRLSRWLGYVPAAPRRSRVWVWWW